MKQVIIAKAIVKQDQKLLLLRRSVVNGGYHRLYELPGGKVDFGENPEAALRREIIEETGRSIISLQLFEVHSLIDGDKQYIILTFLVSLNPETTITLSPEHDKYAWKKLSEVQLNTLTPMTAVSLSLQPAALKTDHYVQGSHVFGVNKSTNNEMIVYADGGSRGNPGPSAAGFVIKDGGDRVVWADGLYLGITTNNQAEYQAVRLALQKAKELGADVVFCRLDSQLVVNQLNGVYQIRNRDLWPIHAAVKELMHRFKKITITHVRREFNRDADNMVNKILDAHV